VANEAREAGRPILVSTAGGLPEQVGSAGLVVDCDDADVLLAALQCLPLQPLAHMARAGRAATQHCGTERAEAWARLIHQLKPRSLERKSLRVATRQPA
jgi:glycosyltransferase involved in cell wall biosynthesis